MSTPPPLPADRNPGDAWVIAPDGTRYWGAFGAAGLLAIDERRGVLLQHRAQWSHHGGTWGIPGGALHADEGALAGALRESSEEAGVPPGAIAPRALHVSDREVWTYTTVMADVTAEFDPVAADAESIALAWVPADEVFGLALHPGFATAWPALREALEVRPAIVVDVANVVGAVPDGWWHDRAAAALRHLERLANLAASPVPAGALSLPLHGWFPRIVAVVEGDARDVAAPPALDVRRAQGSGDDILAAVTGELAGSGHRVTVVTSDRGLRARVENHASVVGARWLLDQFG